MRYPSKRLQLCMLLTVCHLTVLVFVLCEVFLSSKWTRPTAPRSPTWLSILSSTSNCSTSELVSSTNVIETFSRRLCFQHSRPENVSTKEILKSHAATAISKDKSDKQSSLDSWRGIYWRDFVAHCKPKMVSQTLTATGEKRGEEDKQTVLYANSTAKETRRLREAEDELKNLHCGDKMPKRRCGSEKRPRYLCVNPYGRLGNQMFSYASSLGVAVLYNLTLVMDPTMFSGPFKQACKITAEVDWNLDICDDALQRVEAWGGGVFYLPLMYVGKTCGRVQVLLYYFQSWKYFDHAKNAVRRELEFKDAIRVKAESILMKIRKTGCLLQSAAAQGSGSSPQEATFENLTSSSNITSKTHTSVSNQTSWKNQASVPYTKANSALPKLGQNITVTQQNMPVCVNFTGKAISNIDSEYHSGKVINSSTVPIIGQNITQPNYVRSAVSLTLVGLHVRHKDITEEKKFVNFGYQVPPISYFKRAMQHFMLNFSNIVFVITTDDIVFVKKDVIHLCVLIGANCQLIRETPEVDMAVLAGCDHVIMSVGSFGWWAAWLAGGHVVYYKNPARPGSRMRLHMNNDDYYPPSWLGLE